jgi:hypothetical protein
MFLLAPVNQVSEVVHELRREQVERDGARANERGGNGENGFD